MLLRTILCLILSLLMLSGCVTADRNSTELDVKPNLLIVFPDEMRAQTMGFLELEPVSTPNIDQFAQEGLYFSEAVSNYPLCSPFRAMFMTGKYPHRNGVVSNCNSARPNNELSVSDTCWSDILSNNGYSLGYIGKWHLDAPHEPFVNTYNNSPERSIKWNEWCPPERRHGFDFWYAYGTYDRHMNPMYWSTDADRDGFHYVDEWGPIHEADMAIEYIQNRDGSYRNEDAPFALVVSMNPPHTPYNQVPEKYLKQYENLNVDSLANRPDIDQASKWRTHFVQNVIPYYAMVSGVDEQFGRILNALEENGLSENTVVVFMSDHGCNLGMHGEPTKNNPYEVSMRIPFIIRHPSTIAPGESTFMLSVPDIYPTLLDMLGLGDKIPGTVQGRSFASLFSEGNSDSHPESQIYMKMNYTRNDVGARGIRTNKYTMSMNYSRGGILDTVLYNNFEDPLQLKNIAGESPELVSSLLEKLQLEMKRIEDPAYTYFY